MRVLLETPDLLGRVTRHCGWVLAEEATTAALSRLETRRISLANGLAE